VVSNSTLASEQTPPTAKEETMRAQKLTLAALALTAGLSLTACGGDDSGKDSSAKSNSPSSSSSSSGSSSGSSPDSSKGNSSSGGAEAKGAKQGSGDGTEVRGGSENSTGKRSGKGAKQGKFCKLADLGMSARDAKPDEETGNVIVTMTNKSSSTCSVTGFPTVYLKDADNTSNPIRRDDNQPRIADLKPGQDAVFNISYETSPGGEPEESHPTDIEVTPPHETQHASLKWPSGAVKGYYSDVLVHPMHANPMPR
jgi:hypothetical protein